MITRPSPGNVTHRTAYLSGAPLPDPQVRRGFPQLVKVNLMKVASGAALPHDLHSRLFSSPSTCSLSLPFKVTQVSFTFTGKCLQLQFYMLTATNYFSTRPHLITLHKRSVLISKRRNVKALFVYLFKSVSLPFISVYKTVYMQKIKMCIQVITLRTKAQSNSHVNVSILGNDNFWASTSA